MKPKKPTNPDSSKYVYRRRSGTWVLVDKQIINWSKFRKKPFEKLEKQKLGRPVGGKKPVDPKNHDFF